jgi:hypothetical protein
MMRLYIFVKEEVLFLPPLASIRLRDKPRKERLFLASFHCMAFITNLTIIKPITHSEITHSAGRKNEEGKQ